MCSDTISALIQWRGVYLFTRCTSPSSLCMNLSCSFEVQQVSSPSLHVSAPLCSALFQDI